MRLNVLVKKTAILFPLFIVAYLVMQVFFPFASWQFFAYVILAGVMMGGIQKNGALSASIFPAFFYATIFTIASFSALFILLILITNGTVERHDVYDAITLSLIYFVVFFIGSLIGIAAGGLRDRYKARKG